MFKIVFDNITVTNEKLSNFLRGLNTKMSDQAFRIFSTQLNLCCSAFLIFGNQSFGFKVFKNLSFKSYYTVKFRLYSYQFNRLILMKAKLS